MSGIEDAAVVWLEARSAMANMHMNDPKCKAKLNALSEAEDMLSRAVRKQKESENADICPT